MPSVPNSAVQGVCVVTLGCRSVRSKNDLDSALNLELKNVRYTCSRDLVEDGLPVCHLQWSEVCFYAVLPSDSIVDDLDVQLSHPTQNGLEDGEWQTSRLTYCVQMLPVGQSLS